ncbi:MAG TPA: hypothetical protein VIY52_01645 [Streptosporangiaceae bacterium]
MAYFINYAVGLVVTMNDMCALSGMPKDLCGLYSALVDADDQEDTQALARLGWALFTKVSTAQEAHHEAVGLLTELRAAASAVVAGKGSPASLGLLRDVLAKRGWLPPPNATPLQVLATSPNDSRSAALRDQRLPWVSDAR